MLPRRPPPSSILLFSRDSRKHSRDLRGLRFGRVARRKGPTAPAPRRARTALPVAGRPFAGPVARRAARYAIARRAADRYGIVKFHLGASGLFASSAWGATMKLVTCAAVIALSVPMLCSSAWAGTLVYTPINPSFGGDPLNSSHLLGLASAQRTATASDAKSGSGGDGGDGTGSTPGARMPTCSCSSWGRHCRRWRARSPRRSSAGPAELRRGAVRRYDRDLRGARSTAISP